MKGIIQHFVIEVTQNLLTLLDYFYYEFMSICVKVYHRYYILLFFYYCIYLINKIKLQKKNIFIAQSYVKTILLSQSKNNFIYSQSMDQLQKTIKFLYIFLNLQSKYNVHMMDYREILLVEAVSYINHTYHEPLILKSMSMA